MPFGRNPIVNAPGRTSYFTNSGIPYSTVERATDLANIDRLAQPRDTAFINRDDSGTRASFGSGTGIGMIGAPPPEASGLPQYSRTDSYAIGDRVVRGQNVYEALVVITPTTPWNENNWRLVATGKNLLWDNERGEFTGNTGQDIGVVKVTGQHGRYQYRKNTDMVTDIPFIQFGGTNTAIGGRRLVGSQPQLSKRQLHLRDTVVATREYRLRDPKNPFSAEVVPGSQQNVHTHFLEEAVDVFVVGYPANRYQRIPLERGFTPPRYPINTIGGTHPTTGQNLNQFQPDAIGNLPYLGPGRAPTWEQAMAYPSGAIVVRGDALYSANVAIPANTAWNAAQWTFMRNVTTIEINTETYLKDIVVHPNYLNLTITATLANDGDGTATYTVDWGDGTTNAGIASGTAAPMRTYAQTGVYTVRIINDANPADVKEEPYFMKAAGWLPTPLAFDPAFAALDLTTNANAARAGSRPHTFAPFVVQGSPFIKLAVDFGDGAMSGSAHQNLTGFLPLPYNPGTGLDPFDNTVAYAKGARILEGNIVYQALGGIATGGAWNPALWEAVGTTTPTLNASVFILKHRYTHRGTFKMSIWAERLSDEVTDHLGTTPGLTQQRQQIVIHKPVRAQ